MCLISLIEFISDENWAMEMTNDDDDKFWLERDVYLHFYERKSFTTS